MKKMNVIWDINVLFIVVIGMMSAIGINLFLIPRIKEKNQMFVFVFVIVIAFIVIGFTLWYLTDIGFIEPCPSEYRNLSMMLD